MRKFLIVPLCLLFSGCGLLKEARRDIPPPPPRLDYKENEAIKQVAKVNFELAKWVKENGVKPGDQKSILLADGTKVILRYVGEPYQEVDATNLKQDKKIIDRGNDVATDFQKDSVKYEDKMYDTREKIIKATNLKWSWGKILGFFFSSYFLVAIGLVVAACFFPVLLPVVKIFWQLSKAGFGAFRVVATYGVHGILNLVTSLEKFREAHAGTEVGKTLDAHLNATITPKDQASLDALKNHFNI